MKKLSSSKILSGIIILLMLMAFFSCNDNRSNEPEDNILEEKKERLEPEITERSSEKPKSTEKAKRDAEKELESATKNTITNTPNDKIKSPQIDADDYEVKLGVEENIKMYKTGQLIVWIGAAKENHTLPTGMKQDSTYIPANIGQYAKITPYAPDFEVTPSETKCIKIDPSGSEVFFSLKPIKIGSFKVSARIELYSGLGCTGTPIPKTASTLSVIVETDNKRGFKEKLNKMLSVFWDKLLSFWGGLLTLIFAFLLFLIRRKLKRKTGFDQQQENE